MNKRMIFRTLGQITLLEAVLLLLPMAVSFIYRENDCGLSFLVTAALAAFIGIILITVSRPKNKMIFAKEGFVIVSLSWIVLSLIGALPFTISGEIGYVDALFETASGLTTTGASILTDVEALSNGLLFWRSFTHFIGGMGVLVLMMAIVPTDSGRSMNMLKAEVPGPVVGKLVPRIKETARILYIIYIGITLLETICLCIAGMPFFESLLHSFGTAGTGGFGLKSSSVGGYSPAIQWIVAVFMLLFGVNFNLYYLMLKGKFKSALNSRELWFYLGIVFTISTVIALNLHFSLGTGGKESVRDAFFQVSSILTTTGYSTKDFNLWPGLSRGLLFILLFFGGCAGSTAGGLKLARVILLGKMVGRDLRHLLHPHSVGVVKAEGKRVDSQTLNSVSAYFTIYCILIVVVFLLLCLEPFDIETNLSAAISCVNNVGPGFGAIVGPASGYATYSAFSKIVLTMAMLFGRLEIYPILIAITPSTWRKN